MNIIQYFENKRDYAQREIDRETTLGIRCIPLDSQLNAYYQGLRDLSIEILARLREDNDKKRHYCNQVSDPGACCPMAHGGTVCICPTGVGTKKLD